MSKQSESVFLSKLERKYFDALANHSTVRDAANALGISPQTLYNWLYNLKKRYKKKRGWINAVINQKKRNPELLGKILTEKKPMKGIEELSEEEEDLF
jgi:phage antirepressor YoqD-like protein